MADPYKLTPGLRIVFAVALVVFLGPILLYIIAVLWIGVF